MSAPFAILKSKAHWTDGGRDALLYVDESHPFGAGDLVPCLTFDALSTSSASWAWLLATNLAAAYHPHTEATP